MVILNASQTVLILLFKIAERFPVHYLLYDSKGKCRAFSIYALYLQPAAHHLNQALRDGEPQPRPVFFAAGCGIHPLKRTKELRNIFILDTDSRILYDHIHFHRVFWQLLPAHMQRNPALLRITDRI